MKKVICSVETKNNVIDLVENYIKNYSKVRIQQKLDYLSPIEFIKSVA